MSVCSSTCNLITILEIKQLSIKVFHHPRNKTLKIIHRTHGSLWVVATLSPTANSQLWAGLDYTSTRVSRNYSSTRPRLHSFSVVEKTQKERALQWVWQWISSPLQAPTQGWDSRWCILLTNQRWLRWANIRLIMCPVYLRCQLVTSVLSSKCSQIIIKPLRLITWCRSPTSLPCRTPLLRTATTPSPFYTSMNPILPHPIPTPTPRDLCPHLLRSTPSSPPSQQICTISTTMGPQCNHSSTKPTERTSTTLTSPKVIVLI